MGEAGLVERMAEWLRRHGPAGASAIALRVLKRSNRATIEKVRYLLEAHPEVFEPRPKRRYVVRKEWILDRMIPEAEYEVPGRYLKALEKFGEIGWIWVRLEGIRESLEFEAFERYVRRRYPEVKYIDNWDGCGLIWVEGIEDWEGFLRDVGSRWPIRGIRVVRIFEVGWVEK